MAERKTLGTRYGVRYSPLIEVPYFDPIRFCIIYPMHNLFLGTAKAVLKDVWLQNILGPKCTTNNSRKS